MAATDLNQPQTDDLRIRGIKEVRSPEEVRSDFPVSAGAAETVTKARAAIHRILSNEDDRLVVIVGPCSIHDPEAALDYAEKLMVAREQLKGELEIVMRVYFEKPRTTVGWKGLINDPDLDGSFHINKGLNIARELLLKLNERGMPTATEFLDLISPQYVADLISWGAIGARTTESQAHRELASGISCPVGFKNGTDGNLQIAVDAIGAASRPHHFLSVTKAGKSAIFSTTGNEDCHVILRGGNGEPNYEPEHIERASQQLVKAKLKPHLMVDFSHANSRKQHELQVEVGQEVSRQIASGENRVIGAMIESHLREGRQNVEDGKVPEYGVSITDACLAWDDTVPLLATLADAVRKRREGLS